MRMKENKTKPMAHTRPHNQLIVIDQNYDHESFFSHRIHLGTRCDMVGCQNAKKEIERETKINTSNDANAQQMKRSNWHFRAHTSSSKHDFCEVRRNPLCCVLAATNTVSHIIVINSYGLFESEYQIVIIAEIAQSSPCPLSTRLHGSINMYVYVNCFLFFCYSSWDHINWFDSFSSKVNCLAYKILPKQSKREKHFSIWWLCEFNDRRTMDIKCITQTNTTLKYWTAR